MKLTITNNWIYFKVEEGENAYHLYKIISDVCSFDYSVFHKTLGGTKHQEKAISLAEIKKFRFPTGLFSIVVDEIQNYDSLKNIEIEDLREYKEEYDDIRVKFDYDFYEKQLDAILIGLEDRRGYYNIATGGGKTTIIATLAAQLPGKSLILAPSVDLVLQIHEEVQAALGSKETVDMVVGNKTIKEIHNNIVVASSDTLDSGLDTLIESKWFDQFDNLLIDEVHHTSFTNAKVIKEGKKVVQRIPAGFNSYYKIAMECQAANRFGFTATPDENEFFIRAITGKELIEINEDYLISIGRLARPTILLFKQEVPFYEDERKATLNNIYLNENRNQFLLDVMNYLESKDKTSLLMIDSKKYQLDQFLKMKPNLGFITGEVDKKIRREEYKKLESKEIKNIVLTVGKEGLNIPSVDCIIRGSAKKSERLVVQEKGRGSRATKSKSRVLIIDTYDNDGYKKTMKSPGQFRTKKGYLKKHSEERLEIYKKTKSATIKIINNRDDFFKAIDIFFMEK